MELPQPSREDQTPGDLPGLRTPQGWGLRGAQRRSGQCAKLTPTPPPRGLPLLQASCCCGTPKLDSPAQDSTLLALDRASRRQG